MVVGAAGPAILPALPALAAACLACSTATRLGTS
jgi:hypothetical protein